MKRIAVGMVLVVSVVAGGSWMWLHAADRKASPPSRLPDAASRAVQKAVPDADIGDIDENEEDGERRYDVDLRRRSDGGEVNVEVTPDGQITEIEEHIAGSDVPEKVMRSVRKAFPKATVKEAQKRSEIRVTYQLEIMVDGKRREVRVSSRGRILEIEKR